MAVNDYLTGMTRATTGEKTDLSNAAKDLSTLQEGAGSLPTKLKEALNTKLNNNQDIINQQADTMQNYFNAGAVAREKYQDVFNPFLKAKLVQGERSAALRPYDVLSGVLQNRMGSVNDIVQSGIQGWQGLMNAAGTKLDLAKTNMATKLQQYLSAVGQQQSADQIAMQIAQAKEAARQFDISSGQSQQQINNQMSQFEKNYALDQYKARNTGGDGGFTGIGGLAGLSDWKDLFGGNTKSGVTNYQEPPYSPIRAGVEKEYPIGSGVVWVSNNRGGWD